MVVFLANSLTTETQRTQRLHREIQIRDYQIQQMSSVLDDVVDEVEPAPNIVSVMAGTKPSMLLSIDVGTSGVRAALFDERGNEVPGAQTRSHRNLATLSDFAELDADALVDEVVKTIDELLTYHYHSRRSDRSDRRSQPFGTA